MKAKKKHRKKQGNKIKYTILAILLAAALFAGFGIPTALIPTGFFVRMITVSILDYIFLGATSIMMAAYISFHFYRKAESRREGYAAAGGSIAGVFAFGCPVCNALLVSLLGTVTIFTFYEPLRPAIGIVGIAALSYALYIKIKQCDDCRGGKNKR